MIQTVGDADDAVSQAAIYANDLPLGHEKKLWIKLPPTRQSMGCCHRLRDIGCASLMTAVFTPAQAYVAMEAGADGVAVYLGRLMRTESDWRAQLQQIVEIVQESEKTLLLASFQTRETIETGLAFSRNLAMPPALLGQMLLSAQAEDAIGDFETRVTD